MSSISVVVCTRNRAEALGRCLDSMGNADFVANDGQLVLVNNASTDTTAKVMAEFADSADFPIKIVDAPVPGLSNARNAGLAAADAPIVAFTDDDCYVAEDYLSAAITAFSNHDIDYFGGRILRYDESDAFYACNDSEDYEPIAPRSFIPAGSVQGANMAFTRRLLDKVGTFDPNLGAGTRFRCEDVDFIARASAAGFRGAHVPDVLVWHHHGRKEGSELEQLKRDNDYARGAYYAKLIMEFGVVRAIDWMRTTWQLRGHHKLAHEIRGAVDYWRWRKSH